MMLAIYNYYYDYTILSNIIHFFILISLRYTPPLSAVLKFAWIQYMSFFIVVAFLLYQINSFIFEHKLLPTYAAYDIIDPQQKKVR